MPGFDPPSIKPEAAPDFKDSSGCAKWLQSLPLINVGPSHVRLLAQLDELNAYGIAPAERLKILELLREPVSFVQKEHSKKFSSRPAPLAKPEREILERVYALWDALSYGYQHCLKALAGGSSAANAALVGERVLWCIGQRMLASYQAYQDVDERIDAVQQLPFALADVLIGLIVGDDLLPGAPQDALAYQGRAQAGGAAHNRFQTVLISV